MSTGPEPYDLRSPVHLLVPLMEPFMDYNSAAWHERQARIQAERERLEAAALTALAQAMDRWEDLWDDMAENVVATSVLLIHKPVVDDATRVVCTHCEQHNGYEDTEPVDWPCLTYSAIADAPEPQGLMDGG